MSAPLQHGPPVPATAEAAEAEIVAREIASSFGRMLKGYREFYKRTPEEAVQLAEALAAPELDDPVFKTPPDQVSWFDLDHMAKRDPALALRRWSRAGCWCSRGQLHGPYYYRFWRQGGRLVKAYVPRKDVEAVRQQCEARQRLRGEFAEAWQSWRQMVAVIRQAEET